MKKSLLLAVLTFGLPFAAFAATYDYVNTAGSISSVTAQTPDQALVLATDIAPHSGVALDTGTFVTPVGNPSFEYVDTHGNLDTVQASNAAQAFAEATNIAPNSGVMEVSS